MVQSADPGIASTQGLRRRLLIVHPRRHVADLLTTILTPLSLDCHHADGESAVVRRIGQTFALVLIVVEPSNPDALRVLAFSRRKQPWVPVLVLLTVPDAGLSEEAMRLGAAAVGLYDCPGRELREAVRGVLLAARSIFPEPISPIGQDEHPTIADDRGIKAEVRVSEVTEVGNVAPSSPASERCAKEGQRPSVSEETELLLPRHRESDQVGPLKKDVELYERLLILRALRALAWNQSEAARVLGIDRTTLYKKMKRYRLS